MNKWVSVKDRLPDEIGNYLIFIDESVTVSFFDEDETWYDEYIGNREPTHWMPFPDGPEEENDN